MLKKHFNIPKVRNQIMYVFLVATIVPIFIVGVISVIGLRRQMSNQYSSQVESSASKVSSTIFDITTSVYTTSETILSSSSFKKLLSSASYGNGEKEDYNRLASVLLNMHQTTAAISSITVYTNNPNLPSSEHIVYSGDNFSGNPCNYAAVSGVWNSWHCFDIPTTRDSTNYELTLTRKFALAKQYDAYLVVSLSNNNIKNRLLNSDDIILTSVDNLPIFYSTDRQMLKNQIPFLDDFNGGLYHYEGPSLLNGQKYLNCTRSFTPYKTNDIFYISAYNATAYTELNKITVTYSIGLVFAMLIPGILIFSFSAIFSKRIDKLRLAMHHASLGEYDIIDNIKGDDELTETFQDLQIMVKHIQDQQAAFYEEQINQQQVINRQQEMEFKMLASQINPHFLYNTLETIRMQSLTAGNRDVATSIKLLGKSMHYVLENTGTNSTTLDKELDHVNVYLRIQQLRFGDRVNYHFDYPENMRLDNYKILPLLLQPIVENSVIHGLEGVKSDGHITISVSQKNENLVIMVSDNGDGMDEEKLKALNERINAKSLDTASSIGLYNINQRIKLLYGSNYGIEFHSVYEQGTTVTLTIPAIEINVEE